MVEKTKAKAKSSLHLSSSGCSRHNKTVTLLNASRRRAGGPYRTGSRMFRGKRNLKLGVNRAWWALSGRKKPTSKRQPSGGKDMDIDSVAGKQPVRGPSPPPVEVA